jgi:hypothetical protein
MSSITGLTAFIEDELVAPVVPLFINLRDIDCCLLEDRPPIHVGGPPPIPARPMIVRVKHLLVQRNHCGVISVGVNESNPNCSVSRGDSFENIPDLFFFKRILTICFLLQVIRLAGT